MTSPLLTLAIVIAYVVLLFVVSHLSGGNHSLTERTKYPRWIILLALVSAPVTGITFISLPGSVEQDGFSYLQMTLGFIVGYTIIAYGLVPLYYRHNVTSLYEYLDKRFGISSHTTGACFFLVSKILIAALRVFIVCIVVQQLLCAALGVPFGATVVLFMVLVWLYTHRGGISSVIWADLIKTICMTACVAVSIVFVLRSLDISFIEAMRQGSERDLTTTFFFDDINDRRNFAKMFLSGAFMLIATTGLDQDFMQRVLSSDSLRSAQRNMVLSSIFQAVLIALLLVLGTLFYLYIADVGVTGIKADELFAFIMSREGMPTFMSSLLVLGVVAATFSSVGGSLTALTTSFTIDILRTPQRFSREQSTKIHRLANLAIAVVMVLLVFAFKRWGDDSSINLFYLLVSYTYGPLLGMFAFGIFSKRKVRDRWVPAVAVAAPLLCALLDYNSKAWFWGYQFGFEIFLFNTAFTMLGFWAISHKE
jgi:Na+/proline symporter